MSAIFEDLTTSNKLRAFLAIKGITIISIAELLGVTSATIQNRLNSNQWKIDDLKKIAETHGVDITDLI